MKNQNTIKKPFGIVLRGTTPLYVAGRLPLMHEGTGQGEIYCMTDKQAWHFWLECNKMKNHGDLTSKEKQYLSNTMDRIVWMKDYVVKQIESCEFWETLGDKSNTTMPDGWN